MEVKPHGNDLRKGRYSEPNRIYLLTTVTQNRQPWFKDLQCGRMVVQSLMGEENRAETLAFVVMPDHLHWLMSLREGNTLDKVMASVKSVSSHKVNKLLQRTGKVWQEGYHDHALRKDEDVVEVARYLAANPLRAGLVKCANDYPLWDAVWVP
jgi:putative transposase